ncbi:MAG: phosphohistidine phosphatase SixA [Gammaproteobacteria bacterium]
MKLYLARHGIALEANVDPLRPLSEKGKIEITRLADFLSPFGVLVSHVYHSTKLRAQQTAILLAAAIAPGQEIAVLTGLESDSSVELLYQQILGWADDTLLVSHLPFVGELLVKLLDISKLRLIMNWQPGTMVCLERVTFEQWLISWVLTPNAIPDGK